MLNLNIVNTAKYGIILDQLLNFKSILQKIETKVRTRNDIVEIGRSIILRDERTSTKFLSVVSLTALYSAAV